MSATTPEERLRIALDLAGVGEQMMRTRLRREHPEWGLTGRKVFKLASRSLGAGERVRVTKRHPMRAGMTTRQLHPGPHEFQLQINGVDHGTWPFTLV